MAKMEEGRSAFNILTGKRPLGRPKSIWKDNNRMVLKEMGIKARNWVYSAQDRNKWRPLVNAVLNLRFP